MRRAMLDRLASSPQLRLVTDRRPDRLARPAHPLVRPLVRLAPRPPRPPLRPLLARPPVQNLRCPPAPPPLTHPLAAHRRHPGPTAPLRVQAWARPSEHCRTRRETTWERPSLPQLRTRQTCSRLTQAWLHYRVRQRQSLLRRWSQTGRRRCSLRRSSARAHQRRPRRLYPPSSSLSCPTRRPRRHQRVR